jgi:hypothetical protein
VILVLLILTPSNLSQQLRDETEDRHITIHGSEDLTILLYGGGVEGHDWLGNYGMNLVSEGKEMVVGPIHMHSRYNTHKFLAPVQTRT